MNNDINSTSSNSSNPLDTKGTNYLSRFISNENMSNLSCPDILEDILKNAEEEIAFTNKNTKDWDNYLSALNDFTSSIFNNIHKLKATGISALKKWLDPMFKAAPHINVINYKGMLQEKVDKLSDFSRKIYREDIDPAVLFVFVKKHKFIVPIPAFIIIGTIAAFNMVPNEETIAINTSSECKSVVYNSENEVGPLSENKKASLDSQILSNYNFYSYYDIYSTNNTKNKVKDKNILNNILSASGSSKNSKVSSTVTNKQASSKTAGKSILSRSAVHRENMDDIIKNSKAKRQMVATAYDLSVKSCGKSPSHPAYGITKTGTRVTIGRTIAVDPTVIPLRSKLYIEFPDAYKNLNGVYIAEDTGSKIKGNKIDIFFGEDVPGDRTINSLARKFGIQVVNVYILNND
ncbi:3D domain-containing protein [Pseudobacteroides cellulosolvens]|uniref:3D domain-containing protein n=1 Tax=Pseudobacteroides cellulosolvens ATCC 35603 = DSM 2933 TaxID=398512 RepID=A0A0L6JLK2_9FIRM|nr:3D domain-containing protein [Pseudobacteroides cellulosolvens]KNY26247.1 3D domain-containing protein [Pseudobacteroides cellulosolvens ATCC 35603 = DSM 2933]